ncbi:uncharacterized protein LOC116594782 [Mustela erminea]|uniref:uncharacterized protein LOC116594782 n=1 Tax=Mustela erminea TaxID=36723 RepID=UPI001386C69B|nr:uncharacterized protein LOC116594782 [Mustela erminea]
MVYFVRLHSGMGITTLGIFTGSCRVPAPAGAPHLRQGLTSQSEAAVLAPTPQKILRKQQTTEFSPISQIPGVALDMPIATVTNTISTLSVMTDFGNLYYSPLRIWSTRCTLCSHMNIFGSDHALLLSYRHQAVHGLPIYSATILNINISVRSYTQSYNLLASFSLFPFLVEQRHQLTRTLARSQEPGYGEGLHKLGQRFITK